VIGSAADQQGRKYLLFFASTVSIVCSFFVWNSKTIYFSGFLICNELAKAFDHGVYLISFVYAIELANVENRLLYLILSNCIYPLAQILKAYISWKNKHWRTIYLKCMLAITPVAFLTLILPECPRWLFLKEKTTAGKKVIRLMARLNSKKLPLDIWKSSQTAKVFGQNLIKEQFYTIYAIFRDRNIRKLTFLLMTTWTSIMLTYRSSLKLAGDYSDYYYTDQILKAAVDLVSIIVLGVQMHFFEHRNVLVFGCIISNLFLLASAVLKSFSEFSSTTYIVAKGFGITSHFTANQVFACIYIVTMELYPTATRCTGLSIGSIMVRLGGILLLYVDIDTLKYPWMFYSAVTILGFTTSFIVYRFPKTKYLQMETIEESESFYENIQ